MLLEGFVEEPLSILEGSGQYGSQVQERFRRTVFS
jgi:hypothetical protein